LDDGLEIYLLFAIRSFEETTFLMISLLYLFLDFVTNVFTTFTAKTPDAGLFAEPTTAQSPTAKIPDKLFICKF